MSRTIVITGVSRGLGRALASEFIRLGHTVVGCGRNGEAIAALRAQYPAPHRFDAVDVASDAAVAAWAASVQDSHGAPHLLLNNAALINRLAPLWQMAADEFDCLIDVNIKGVTNMLRHFLPAMIAAGRGVIVNFSSGWGRSVDAHVAPYCASKWAIEGLTRALALELPAGLAAVSFNPGIIDTDMLRTAFGNAASQYPAADVWARRAAPFLLGLGPACNGQPLDLP